MVVGFFLGIITTLIFIGTCLYTIWHFINNHAGQALIGLTLIVMIVSASIAIPIIAIL